MSDRASAGVSASGRPEAGTSPEGPSPEGGAAPTRPLRMTTEAALRAIIERLTSHRWIIATAYNGADFGYQVNVAGKVRRNGVVEYNAWRETFAATSIDAGLNGLRLEQEKHDVEF